MSAYALPASVTMPTATAALRGVEAALAAGGDLEIDASAVVELDTAAIALLLQSRRLAIKRGVAFRLRGTPPKLQALAALYGVESLLSVA
jgi:phospholipid transport system transporter-binding protein